MPRMLLIALGVLALAATACTRSTDTGAQRFVVDVDAESTPEAKAQFSAFFPGALRVAAGDTVHFRNRATEAPHTITFGVEADRSNAPPLFVPKGENPVVLEACDVDDAPSPELVKCDNERLGAYDGTGYWNSGFLMPKPASRDAGPKAVTVTLAEDIEPGEYTYVCVLHNFMNGTVEVVDDAGELDTPADVRAQAEDAVADARKDAEGFEEPKLEERGDEVTVTAGWGDKITSINRFGPAEIEVEEGTTVNWAIDSPYEPHTVTLDAPFDDLSDPRAFAPGGVLDGEDYEGGFSNSGFLGKLGAPYDSFSLRFTKAGTYEYVCVLHPGMDGVVKVT